MQEDQSLLTYYYNEIYLNKLMNIKNIKHIRHKPMKEENCKLQILSSNTLMKNRKEKNDNKLNQLFNSFIKYKKHLIYFFASRPIYFNKKCYFNFLIWYFCNFTLTLF